MFDTAKLRYSDEWEASKAGCYGWVWASRLRENKLCPSASKWLRKDRRSLGRVRVTRLSPHFDKMAAKNKPSSVTRWRKNAEVNLVIFPWQWTPVCELQFLPTLMSNYCLRRCSDTTLISVFNMKNDIFIFLPCAVKYRTGANGIIRLETSFLYPRNYQPVSTFYIEKYCQTVALTKARSRGKLLFF